MAEQKRRPGRPATGVTPMRSFRMGDIYDRALEVAEQRGEKLRDVIERKLQEYINDDHAAAYNDEKRAPRRPAVIGRAARGLAMVGPVVARGPGRDGSA